MRKILEEDFKMDLTQLDKLKDELENKNSDGDIDEKDFSKITDVMGDMFKNMNNKKD